MTNTLSKTGITRNGGENQEWKVIVFSEYMKYVGSIEVLNGQDKRTITALNNSSKGCLDSNGLHPKGFIALNDVQVYSKSGGRRGYGHVGNYESHRIKADSVFLAYDLFPSMGDDAERLKSKKYESWAPSRIQIITEPFESVNYKIEGDIRKFQQLYNSREKRFLPIANCKLERIVAKEQRSIRQFEFPFMALNKDYIQSYGFE